LNLDDLKKLLKPADILLIIPPFCLENFQSLGAHILQACCREAGLSLQIFYANILFASYIKDEYEILCNMNNSLIGERIFSRAAFGDQVKDNIHDNVYNYAHLLGAERANQIKNPFYFFPPIEQLSISKLREIEEIAYTWIEEISQLISAIPYKIIGCSSSYEQTNASFAFLKQAKKYNSDITTIIGGFNCEGECSEGIASLDPEKKVIDYIFSGESEDSLINFLTNFKKNIKAKNRIIYGKPCTDMDKLPEVDYSQYFEQLYSFQPFYALNQQSINICYETSRGCWWGEKCNCLFCGGNGNRLVFRQKSATKILKGLREIKKYKMNYLQMTDLIMPEDYFTTLIPELKNEKHDFKIYYEQKANLSFEKLRSLKNVKITEIQPGIETFSDALLNHMKKGTSSWKNIQLLRDGLTLNINVYWNIIWGFPGEKSQEYENMNRFLPLLFHLQPPVGVFHLSITRFSPYFNNYKQYGINNLKPINSYQEIYPAYADIEKIAGFFVADYNAETYHDSVAIAQFIDMIHKWNESWHIPEDKPLLILSKQSDDEYIIQDTRNIKGTKPLHIINRQRAISIQQDRKYIANDHQLWAIDNKVALVIEDRFIPLVTSNVDLIEELNLKT